MRHITKRYSNGEVTVIWQPDLCVHAGNCARGLPRVFNPRRRPWVDATAATTAEIVGAGWQVPVGRAVDWARRFRRRTPTPQERMTSRQ